MFLVAVGCSEGELLFELGPGKGLTTLVANDQYLIPHCFYIQWQ